jgi:hypothetical protein
MSLPIFQRTIVNESGDVVNGASVEVRRESDGALALIYSNRQGTVIQANPVITGTDGLCRFYAPAGEYQITATIGGQQIIWRWVAVGMIPSVSNFGSGMSPNYIAIANGTGQGQRAGYSFRSTFEGSSDNGPRRSADVWSGFNGGTWGSEFLAFGVGSNDAANVSTERMRINGAGNLQIGSTSSSTSRVFVRKDGQTTWANRNLTIEDSSGTSSQPGIGFHAAGNTAAGILKLWGPTTRFELRNAEDAGFIAVAASSFDVSSDYRIKSDVTTTACVLPSVMSLRPVSYKKDGSNGREHGLIAHEVAEHFPELVSGEKDAMRDDGSMELQTVNYMALTAILTKAIQEQQFIIDGLKARIDAAGI